MKRIYFLLIFILLFLGLIISCSPTDYPEETKTLQSYLKKTFDMTMPEDSTKILLVPDFVCSKCMKGYFKNKRLKKTRNDIEKYIILSANIKTRFESTIENLDQYQILIDTNNNLDYIKTFSGGMSEVLIENKVITKFSRY